MQIPNIQSKLIYARCNMQIGDVFEQKKLAAFGLLSMSAGTLNISFHYVINYRSSVITG